MPLPRFTSEAAGPTAFNVYAGEEGAIVTANARGSIPNLRRQRAKGSGHDPREAVRGACRKRSLHLHERGLVELEKTFRLPFLVDTEKTEASYERGVLIVRLHKVEEAKPARIAVRTV